MKFLATVLFVMFDEKCPIFKKCFLLEIFSFRQLMLRKNLDWGAYFLLLKLSSKKTRRLSDYNFKYANSVAFPMVFFNFQTKIAVPIKNTRYRFPLFLTLSHLISCCFTAKVLLPWQHNFYLKAIYKTQRRFNPKLIRKLHQKR